MKYFQKLSPLFMMLENPRSIFFPLIVGPFSEGGLCVQGSKQKCANTIFLITMLENLQSVS